MCPEPTQDTCCPTLDSIGHCTVEAIVSIDERGQMVLPKELRIRAGITPGDKLAVIGWERDQKVCCIMLILAERLNEPVKTVVGPMIKEVL